VVILSSPRALSLFYFTRARHIQLNVLPSIHFFLSIFLCTVVHRSQVKRRQTLEYQLHSPCSLSNLH
jgi:hypothetical protein